MRAVMLEVPQALLEERRAKVEPVGPVVVECLGVRAETVDGKLRLTWETGTAEI